MESRFFLNVIIRKSATVLELLAGKDKTLLVGRNAFFILNLGFHVVNGVGRLNLERDGLPGEGFDEYLHTTTKTKDEMKSGFLLDVVVGEGTTILELLSSEDEALLVRRNTRGDSQDSTFNTIDDHLPFFVLDFGLDVVDGVRRLDFQSDGLARQSLDKDLHPTTEAEYKMEGRLLLNVIIREGSAIFKLFARKDEALLVGRDPAPRQINN